MPGNHRRRAGGSGAESWRSWLWVLAGVTGFALTALQPSIVVAQGPAGQLVAARTPDGAVQSGVDAARDRLEDAGLADLADHLPAGSPSGPEMVDTALAERDRLARPGEPGAGSDLDRATATPAGASPTTATDAPPTTTTVVAQTTTTNAPATKSTTTTDAPASKSTTTDAPATTITTDAPAEQRTGSAADAERRFVALLNQERANEGLDALQVDADIHSVARDWSNDMARGADGCGASELRHNPDYAEEMPPGWSRVGENVGCGSSVASIHRAFMASAGHRGHILDPDFTHVGVGVAVAPDGTIWVTQNFGRY